MTERDAFEARFAAAVQGYAGRLTSELDPVELAHRIAAREPRRHGFAAAVALRGITFPARVWVLLLLAALLIGLVAGTLVVGSRPPELRAVMPIAEVLTCPAGTNPDEPGRVDQARPVQDADIGFAPLYSTLAVADSRIGRLVVVFDTGSRVETWTFDLCTNSWIQMHPVVEPPRFDYGRLAYDVDSDATILATSSGSVWTYDLSDDTWTQMRAAPIAAGANLWAFDPLSERVVFGNESSVWSYEARSNTWTPIHRANGLPGWMAVFDASLDRIVFPGSETTLFDIRTGTWSRAAAEMPIVIAGFGMSSPFAVYDAAAERTVVIGNERLAAYDATADRWEIVLDLPDLLPLPVAYDPVNRRLIGLSRGGVVDSGGVVAFDLVSRQWTVLLGAR